jgi:hypothetical protein
MCVCVRLCSQAEGSWSKERCCAVQGNECPDVCADHTSSSDYLYRLSPGEPERYELTWPPPRAYQIADPHYWPTFGLTGGGFDLLIGIEGYPLGAIGSCRVPKYLPTVCGGSTNWGHTDLEVWRPL